MDNPLVRRIGTTAVLIALVLSGLEAGFFYTWSFTIMNGFDAADPAVAIQAMQAINANIRNPWFGAVFFGMPLIILIAAISLICAGRRMDTILTGLALVGAAAVVAITAILHVPWNDALANAGAPSEPGAAAQLWRDYSQKWTAWNHVRTAAGLLAFSFMAWVTVRSLTRRL